MNSKELKTQQRLEKKTDKFVTRAEKLAESYIKKSEKIIKTFVQSHDFEQYRKPQRQHVVYSNMIHEPVDVDYKNKEHIIHTLTDGVGRYQSYTRLNDIQKILIGYTGSIDLSVFKINNGFDIGYTGCGDNYYKPALYFGCEFQKLNHALNLMIEDKELLAFYPSILCYDASSNMEYNVGKITRRLLKDKVKNCNKIV